MNTQSLITAVVALCSLGGWYVVLAKYIEIRTILKERERFKQMAITKAPIPPTEQYAAADDGYDDIEYIPGKHIPGMGPEPLLDIPQNLPFEDYFANLNKPTKPVTRKIDTQPTAQKTAVNINKRQVCNWATIIHLSGFSIVTGFPLLNIVIPTILWLIKKEQHPFLDKHGREVINFQITLTLVQFTCLVMGTIFIWLFPAAASSLFNATKTMHIVFASSMYLPFNLFTLIPFVWGCIMIMRGAIAAYRGFAYIYPYTKPFIAMPKIRRTPPQLPAEEPAPAPEPFKFNFG